MNFIDEVVEEWEQSPLRNGQMPVYRNNAFFEYDNYGRRNPTHYHIFRRRHGNRYQLGYQLTHLGRHNVEANGDEIYEGPFNNHYTAQEWVDFFANNLDQCMNGDFDENFNLNGGGKKGKRTLKNRSKRSATHRKKKHATRRR
jgi:hypothetical protein